MQNITIVLLCSYTHQFIDCLKSEGSVFYGVQKCGDDVKLGTKLIVNSGSNLFISNRAELRDNCIISGYVLLGEGVATGFRNVLNSSIIGHGTHIGDFSKVIGSIIGNKVVFGERCKVYTARIGNDSKVLDKSAVIVATLGENTSIGPNSIIGRSSLADGVIIYENSCVGSGVSVTENIPSRHYINSDKVLNPIPDGFIVEFISGDCVLKKYINSRTELPTY